MKIPNKVKKTLYVTVATRGYLAGQISINDYDCTSFSSCIDDGVVLVCTTEIEVDLPENFDPTEKVVALLEKRRAALVQAYSLKIEEVDRDLEELRSLPSPESDKEKP